MLSEFRQDSVGWKQQTAPQLHATFSAWNEEFNQTAAIETLLGMVVRETFLSGAGHTSGPASGVVAASILANPITLMCAGYHWVVAYKGSSYLSTVTYEDHGAKGVFEEAEHWT